MGCDIHAFIEMKVNGKWHFVGELIRSRDYDLFSALSGVRGEHDAFFKPNVPLPKDCCSEIRKELDPSDHSLTVIEDAHASLSQFLDYAKECKLRSDLPKQWERIAHKLVQVPFVETTRVVLWYDN